MDQQPTDKTKDQLRDKNQQDALFTFNLFQ
jgi:hypothetical protein